jgi:hypothetical protein
MGISPPVMTGLLRAIMTDPHGGQADRYFGCGWGLMTERLKTEFQRLEAVDLYSPRGDLIFRGAVAALPASYAHARNWNGPFPLVS